MRGRPAHRETYMYNPVNFVRKPTNAAKQIHVTPDTDLCGCYQEHTSRQRRQGASNYMEWHLDLRAFSAFHIRTLL